MTYADEIGEAAFERLVTDFFANHYHDRGMVKWQGYYLSDHTAALKKQAQDEADRPQPLPQQSQEEVRTLLAQAYATGQSVSVQLLAVDADDQVQPSIVGKLGGTADGDFVIIGDHHLPIDQLRHVTVLALPVT